MKVVTSETRSRFEFPFSGLLSGRNEGNEAKACR
jgi:hypothetical protein